MGRLCAQSGVQNRIGPANEMAGRMAATNRAARPLPAYGKLAFRRSIKLTSIK